MTNITWKTRECGTITDCTIQHNGRCVTIPFEHPLKMHINEPLNCLGYLLNACAVYTDSSLEEQIAERFGPLSEVSHKEYLCAVEIWEVYRDGYIGMHTVFTAEEMDLLYEIVPTI